MKIENSIFWFLATLFFIEQILYWFMWSYPYRFGILVKKTMNSQRDITFWQATRHQKDRLFVKIDKITNDVFLRYKYPFGAIGPLLFIGQISSEDSKNLHVRVGLFSAIFVLWLIITPIIFDGDFIGSILIMILVAWFYIALLSGYKRIIRKSSEVNQ